MKSDITLSKIISVFIAMQMAIANAVFCVYADTKNIIKMATTTSTENSGLLSYLLPLFEKETGIKVQAIAVGTGKAIKLGENGDVDVLLVHAKEDELKFVADGFGVDRRDVMYNDFIVVGPSSDPAGIKKAKRADEVFKIIASEKKLFVSRGDESGTHKKEKQIWATAKTVPDGAWYIEAGQGMEPVLVMASEKQGYTLADRGTFIAVEDKVELEILHDGDPGLFNQYGVIVVNPEKHPHVKFAEAKLFVEWITSEKGQSYIAQYKIKDKQLFFPNSNR